MSLRNLALDFVFPSLYRLFCLQPVRKDFVLFVEFLNTEVDPSFTSVYERVRACDSLNSEYISTERWKGAVASLVGHVRLLARVARAGTIFLRTDSSIISCLPLRSQTTVVQLWHACVPLKRFGLSTAEKGYGASVEEFTKHPPFRNLSYAPVCAEELVWAYEEAMGLKGEGIVQPLGVARTDEFFDASFIEQAKAEVRTMVPGAEGKKLLLYAPTFRGETREASAPDQLDIKLLKETLGNDYALVIKHHPMVREIPPIPAGCEDFAYLLPKEASISTLIAGTDVCVTDYSSLVSEWSLLEKPIAFFVYDIDDYVDQRGFYYDFDELTPGPVCLTTQELASWVRSLDTGFDRREIVAFRKRFMGACDGKSTSRILHAALPEVFPACD